MAPTPAEMVDLLDAKIATELAKPQSQSEEGRAIQRRTLTDLRDTRKYYADLGGAGTSAEPGFQMRKIRTGGAR